MLWTQETTGVSMPTSGKAMHMCRRLCLVLMAAFVAPTLCAGGDGIARAVLFVSPTCPHCRTVREQVLPKLGARFGDKLRLLIVGTNTRPGYELYLAA